MFAPAPQVRSSQLVLLLSSAKISVYFWCVSCACASRCAFLGVVVLGVSALGIDEPFAGFERDGEIHLWLTKRLWELAKGLPVFEYEVASFECFDKDVWFGFQHKPTVNKVLEHYKKIENATFEYPIILSRDGIVFDGVHRICRARLDGRATIPAVRFEIDPEPDRKRPVPTGD